MKKALIYLFILVGVSSTFLVSCKKSNLEMGDYIGQPICPSDNFAILTPFAYSSSVSFVGSPYYTTFSAEINENLVWEITITGQTSGAVKTFTGRSPVISVRWYGNSDGDVFFTNEVCDVTFRISCREAESYTMTITNKSRFNSVLDTYILMTDYDGFGTVASNWPTYTPPAGTTATLETANGSPQGGSYRRLTADQGYSNWYFNGFGSTVDLSPFATSDPDEVYVNFYMKGNSEKATVTTIQFTDADGAKYKKNFVGDFDEWRMISYPLSYFNVYDASTINMFEVSIGPVTEDAASEVSYDFIILSKGGPIVAPN